MAYSITELINQYNTDGANMIANSIIPNNGLMAYAQYQLANKQLAHNYSLLTTLPTAGIRTLGDGIAASTVSGSYTTTNLSLFAANGKWDQAYVGSDVDSFMLRNSPKYIMSTAKLASKAFIYGATASFGDASYTGTGLHQYCSASATTQRIALSTGSSQTGATSIFAIRFSPMEDIDGAAIIVDPLTDGSLFFYNLNYNQLQDLSGNTGTFPGYSLWTNMHAVMILPGTNDAAQITGITNALTPTATQIDQLLDMVNADNNTILVCNLRGKRILNNIGKGSNIVMSPNEYGYSSLISTWNGVPIVVDNNIVDTETSALYGY